MNYIVVKGNKFKDYNGSYICVGLQVHATCSSKEEARTVARKLYDEETDLILVINLETGKEEEI